jgi:hypothetical protein
MIIKTYKRIHSRYLAVFNFFFFLRYVFAIFLISISLFFIIPKFFNYEKKIEIIKEYLVNYYDLELKSYSHIEFKIFPLPNLTISNIDLSIKNKSLNLKSERISIFLHFKSIYNYENLEVKKIHLHKNKVISDIDKTKNLIEYLIKSKKKLAIENLNINLKKNSKSLIDVKNINLSNYGYKKNEVTGKIFGKKFKISLKNKNKELKFELLETGIKGEIKFLRKSLNSMSGSSKINLSNNLLKFDFNFNNKNELQIFKSNFRNKDLSLSLDSLIKFNPFFIVRSNVNVKEFDDNLLDKINLEKILKDKNIIKKLNNKINVSYKSKKYFTNLIENYSSNISLAYGRLTFSNKILIIGGEIICKGNSILIEDYPRLNFNCLIILKDKKKIFKKFLISNKKVSNDPLNLDVEGSLNLFNKKINFKKISVDNNKLENKEDINYFKDKFESILFNESFFQIFNKNKIKEFLIEII